MEKSGMVTQKEIARIVGLNRATVAKILNRDPKHRVSEETRRRVFEVAHKLGYNFSLIRTIHRRAFCRVPVRWEARVRTFPIDGAEVFSEGKGRVSDISPAGMLLSDLILSGLPAHPFYLEVEIIEGPLSGIIVLGEPRRLDVKDHLSIGIAFRRISGGDRDRLVKWVTHKSLDEEEKRG